MASKLLVKRSTGTAAPGTVDFGELALTGLGQVPKRTSETDCLLETIIVLLKWLVVNISPTCWIKYTV